LIVFRVLCGFLRTFLIGSSCRLVYLAPCFHRFASGSFSDLLLSWISRSRLLISTSGRFSFLNLVFFLV
jgi:hypothetical protein